MSNVYPLVTQELREEQASLWLARLDAGLDPHQAQELREWMWADSKNQQTLSEMAVVWDKMDLLANLSDVFPHSPETVSKRQTRWLAVAAVVMVAVVGGLIAQWQAASQLAASREVASYETPVGDQANVVLTDGSTIKINTNTRVDIDFDQHNRLLYLERGEFHIDVAHDPERPLSVYVGDRILQAVGTAFNVRIDDTGQVELVVTDGKVLVGVRQKDTSGSPVSLGGSALAVEKGKRAVFDDRVGSVETLAPDQIEIELAWREGILIFQGETLQEATREIG